MAKRRKFLNFPSSSARSLWKTLVFRRNLVFFHPLGWCESLSVGMSATTSWWSWRSESGKMSDLSWVNVWILMARVELLWRNFHWTTISNLKHFLLTRRRRHSISMILKTTTHNGWENDKVRVALCCEMEGGKLSSKCEFLWDMLWLVLVSTRADKWRNRETFKQCGKEERKEFVSLQFTATRRQCVVCAADWHGS